MQQRLHQIGTYSRKNGGRSRYSSMRSSSVVNSNAAPAVKGINFSSLVNNMLHKDIELIEIAK